MPTTTSDDSTDLVLHTPIPTWTERCETHPAHTGVVTHAMIQARMQEEIDDLRTAFKATAKALLSTLITERERNVTRTPAEQTALEHSIAQCVAIILTV